MPWALPLLALSPEVLFVGFLLVALAIASTVVYKTAGQSTGLTGVLTAPLRAVVNAWHSLVRATVSRFAVAHLTPLVRFFASLNALVLGASLSYSSAMATIAASIERLTHHTIPREAGKAAAPAKAKADAASKAATKAQSTASHTSTTFRNYRTRTAPRIAHATHAVDVTIPAQLGRVRTRTATLEGEFTDLRGRTKALEDGALDTWKWIRSHPLSGVTGIFAGAVAIALSRIGWGVLRCRSWQKLGRSLKCSDANILADLLAAATLSVGLVSLVELAKEEQRIVAELARAVHFVLEA